MSEPKKIDDGGPAFPNSNRTYHDESRGMLHDLASVDGMTLRDYFAAKALQGICSGMNNDRIHARAKGVLGGVEIAKASYVLADAMIAAGKV